MKNYRPLLLQNIDLRLPGLTVHRLRLNQHTPEGQWSEHSHESAQLLVYLGGRGQQKVDGETFDCRPGTIIHVAPGVSHAFERQRARQPLCLVLDVDLDSGRSGPFVCSQLPNTDLTNIRSVVSRLFRIRQLDQREMMLQVGASLLEILDRVLRVTGWLKPVNRFSNTRQLSTTRMVEKAIANHDGAGVELQDLAEKIGFQPDHLNRVLKQECGLTLGQLRSRSRLKKAQQLLERGGMEVQEIAAEVGILDNNYFSRWFKGQTGMTPRQWKSGG